MGYDRLWSRCWSEIVWEREMWVFWFPRRFQHDDDLGERNVAEIRFFFFLTQWMLTMLSHVFSASTLIYISCCQTSNYLLLSSSSILFTFRSFIRHHNSLPRLVSRRILRVLKCSRSRCQRFKKSSRSPKASRGICGRRCHCELLPLSPLPLLILSWRH